MSSDTFTSGNFRKTPDGDFLAIGIYEQARYVYRKYTIIIAENGAYVDYSRNGSPGNMKAPRFIRQSPRKGELARETGSGLIQGKTTNLPESRRGV